LAGPRLPALNGRRVVQTLKRLFVVDRVVGSHHVIVHSDDHARTVTVPIHSGRDLKAGSLHSIIRQAGLSVAEFVREL
jgi:predicted RNA binding protein YcfA (HicA-like mRNA interferase family)